MAKERQDVPPLRLSLPVRVPDRVCKGDDLEKPPHRVDLQLIMNRLQRVHVDVQRVTAAALGRPGRCLRPWVLGLVRVRGRGVKLPGQVNSFDDNIGLDL